MLKSDHEPGYQCGYQASIRDGGSKAARQSKAAFNWWPGLRSFSATIGRSEVFMSRSSKHRTAVYVAIVPAYWTPQRPWNIPPSFSERHHSSPQLAHSRGSRCCSRHSMVSSSIEGKSTNRVGSKVGFLCAMRSHSNLWKGGASMTTLRILNSKIHSATRVAPQATRQSRPGMFDFRRRFFHARGRQISQRAGPSSAPVLVSRDDLVPGDFAKMQC